VDADSDAALLDALRAGDREAFEAVVREWTPGLLRAARGYVSTDAAAHEAVQETWLAVITGLDRFEGRSRLRTWVHGILANVARRRAVQERRSVPVSSFAPDDGGAGEGPVVDLSRFRGPGEAWPGHWRDEATPEPWGPEGRLLTAELQEMLVAALDTLPERQRQVVVLRDLEGLSTPEVAAVLDLSEGNVRVLLHRGRMRLRELLEDYLRGHATRLPEEVSHP
jgi:RNA polymerase sigma-70 factor (ECF subfamily)